jgi:hypothetical protein
MGFHLTVSVSGLTVDLHAEQLAAVMNDDDLVPLAGIVIK